MLSHPYIILIIHTLGLTSLPFYKFLGVHYYYEPLLVNYQLMGLAQPVYSYHYSVTYIVYHLWPRILYLSYFLILFSIFTIWCSFLCTNLPIFSFLIYSTTFTSNISKSSSYYIFLFSPSTSSNLCRFDRASATELSFPVRYLIVKSEGASLETHLCSIAVIFVFLYMLPHYFLSIPYTWNL